MLEISKEGVLKTQMMYRANLSYTQLSDYLNFMLGINLLEKNIKYEKEIYKPTGKGLDFLQKYIEIQELLKTETNINTAFSSPEHLLEKTRKF